MILPIKTLKDKNGNPFVPVTSPNSIIYSDGKTLEQYIQDALDATQDAENVDVQLNGTILTVTNRNGQSTSVNTKGEQGATGAQGERGDKGDKGDPGTTDYNDLINKPTIPDAVSGVNNGTNWTQITIGNITKDIPQGIAAYTPTLQSAPTSSTTTYVKDGQTIDFEIGQFARVANQNNPTGYDMWQVYDLTTESNVTTAAWRLVLPNNVAYLKSADATAYSPNFDVENDTVHVTVLTLTSSQKAQARTNIDAADASTAVNSSAIRNIVTISQVNYDALSSKDNTTLYIIT